MINKRVVYVLLSFPLFLVASYIMIRLNKPNSCIDVMSNAGDKEVNIVRSDTAQDGEDGSRNPSNSAITTPTTTTTTTATTTNAPTTNKISDVTQLTSTAQQKQSILLFIGIMSASLRLLRRNALRSSWLSHCKHYNVSCWIFTDAQDVHGERLPDHEYVPLKQEQYLHGDLILTESPGGINFARRYLWIINWANERYNFEYLLRVDDDYFICMDRLLLELPFRPKEKLYWGHVHCDPPGGIRVDEGFVIVSNDLVQEFLREQDKSLMCHPFGDQAMQLWINNIPGVTYFGDPRVYHSVSANEPILEQFSDICASFLALHGSYPVQLERYWLRYLSTPAKRYPIPGITYPCGDQDKKYSSTHFLGMYHADPVPCKEKPVWNLGDVYVGRSGF